MSDRYLTVDDLARLLCLSPGTIRNKLSRGESLPPSVRLPGCRRRLWRESQVIKWLDNQVVLSVDSLEPKAKKKRGRPKKSVQVRRRVGLKHEADLD